MKVFSISAGYDACFAVRCLIASQQIGWWTTPETLKGKHIPVPEQTKRAMEADIIVFQRPMTPDRYDLAKILKSIGKKVVMDNDDTYVKDSGLPKLMADLMEKEVDKYIEKVDFNLKNFAELADMVTVSTPFLAKEYEKVSKNVVVLPNFVEPDDWDEPLRDDGDKVRIGLVGSVASSDFLEIKDVLVELSKRDDIQLVIMGLPPKEKKYSKMQEVFKEVTDFWASLDVEWHPFCDPGEYAEKLNELKLDMMLIPRIDNYFNKCKSNIKFLEASMCEIPVITSKFKDSPYEKDKDYLIQVKKNGWMDAIDSLVERETLRHEIGEKAREYVLREYNIKTKYKLWEKAYQSLM